jgi:hypothetical protein
MSQSLPPRRRLSVEQLEDRLTPTFGTPWFNGSHLTLSFAPDGTNVSGQASNLFALMNATTPQAQWEQAILRAYQTWTVSTNLNVGLVYDNGAPLGIAGPTQGDVQFGDVRVAGAYFSPLGTAGSTEADTNGPDRNSLTAAGDSVYNAFYKFGIGDIPGTQSDLYSVALHEAGHSFGLADQNTDPTSVMYNQYHGLLTGLSPLDVSAIQELYGTRTVDPYGTASGNGTFATAYNLGTATAISAQLSQIGDSAMYQFTTPSSWSTYGLTVNLKAAGISLLTSRVNIFDAQGNLVTTAVTTDPTNNNLSIAIPNYRPSSTYYVQVTGASGDVFSVGAYVLSLNYTGAMAAPTVTQAYYTNTPFQNNNNTFATALALSPVQSTLANSFTVSDALPTGAAVKWYSITPNLPTATTGTLYVDTSSLSGLVPVVSVYDSNGNLLPAAVTLNQAGAYAVQIAGASTGTTYYIAVSSADGVASGSYTLGAAMSPSGPIQFISTTSDTLSSADAINATQLTVTGDRFIQFAIGASGGSTTTTTAVRMSLFDANGRLVFTFVAVAGGPISTGALWLASGTYTIAFNAATADGSPIQSLSVSVSSRTLSDPIDPYTTDQTPPLLAPIQASVPQQTTPPASIVDAVANPFAAVPMVPPTSPPPPPLPPGN